MKKGLNTFLSAILALGTTGLAFAASVDQPSQQITNTADARLEQRLSKEVRHELNMIPQFTVFDNLAYRVDGGTVTLLGQVRDGIVKDSAEARVKHLEGVERVDNQIEILPASFNDDRIRRQVARAVFNDPRLFNYAIQPTPPIHIIVKNGHVDLEGVERVDNRIEILPASFNDDRIRGQVARAVFNDPRLFNYAIQPTPPIHIIVKNGHVDLEGVVRTQAEKDDAFIRANGVSGVFSVQNNLQVEQPKKG